MDERVAEFWGGPLDGEVRVFEGGPPLSIIALSPFMIGLAAVAEDKVEVPDCRFTYRLAHSARDHGPLWLYVPERVG